MFAKVLNFSQVDALTVVQLATADQNSVQYISGPEAIRKNCITVEELSEGGNVNRLRVKNISEYFIFFMDGDVLMGAKQNRVLNTSVFIKPQSETIIPVSCVERGRWRQKSQNFSDTKFSVPPAMRASKAKDVKMNLRANHEFDSNQGKVWDSVANYSALYSFKSSTANLEEVMDSQNDIFEDMVKGIKPIEFCNGLAIFIGDKLLNIDIFNRIDIYREYFPKLVRSAAMDAYHVKPKKVMERAEAEYKTLDFLDKFETLRFETHPAVAEGEEKRFEVREVTGFELTYKKNLIHLAALNLA